MNPNPWRAIPELLLEGTFQLRLSYTCSAKESANLSSKSVCSHRADSQMLPQRQPSGLLDSIAGRQPLTASSHLSLTSDYQLALFPALKVTVLRPFGR
jgi:hypothetical protein